MHRYWLLLIIYANLLGVSAAEEEAPYKLEPTAPRLDEPFEVIFVADAPVSPEGVRYDWFVHAKTAGMEVVPTSAGVPDPAPNSPRLGMFDSLIGSRAIL